MKIVIIGIVAAGAFAVASAGAGTAPKAEVRTSIGDVAPRVSKSIDPTLSSIVADTARRVAALSAVTSITTTKAAGGPGGRRSSARGELLDHHPCFGIGR